VIDGADNFALPEAGMRRSASRKRYAVTNLNVNAKSDRHESNGFSHVALSTLDLDKTRGFYEDVLGFRAVIADLRRREPRSLCRDNFGKRACAC
jgi:hypothetical protein